MVSSIRLTLCTSVRINVALFSPSSAERRFTTSGPRLKPPSLRGPSLSSSQEGMDGNGAVSSWGGRTGRTAGGAPVGSKVASRPAKAANTVSSARDRHHTRTGTPLHSVISSSNNSRETRQNGPANTGVSRNISTQPSFRRGSSQRSQPALPSTNWPMGICRNQSIDQLERLC